MAQKASTAALALPHGTVLALGWRRHMRHSCFTATVASLLLLGSRAANAAEQPNAIFGTLGGTTEDFSIGLGYSRDLGAWGRLTLQAGGYAIGDASQNWQTLDFGLRLLGAPLPERAPVTHASVFAVAGLGHFYRAQRPDGYQTFRDTLGPIAALRGDLTHFGSAGRGVTAQVTLGALLVVDQNIQNHEYKKWPRYSVAPVVMVSCGYSF